MDRRLVTEKPDGSLDLSDGTLACPFEKAILSRTCGCSRARRRSEGHRSTVRCDTEIGQQNCVTTMGVIRKSAAFTLGVVQTPGALPNTQAAKLQSGGLSGLQGALDPGAEHDRVRDIYGLIKRALARYGSLQDLPQQEMVRGVAAFNK